MNKAKKLCCVTLAAAFALPLAACSTEAEESAFDNPLPWHTAVNSYERLVYDVAIYDVSKRYSEAERVKIAGGELEFVLDDGIEIGYTTIDMNFSVTYDRTDAAEIDRGLTDKITSRVSFEPRSLAARRMTKTVELADREDKDNLSYTVTADYFDEHKATLKYTKRENSEERTKSLSRDISRDNEMLFYLARAQSLSESSSTNFKITNIFDYFLSNDNAQYRMAIAGGAQRDVDIGDFVKDFGVPAVTDEASGEVSYPVKCITATIAISAENRGPAYTVLYSVDPFVTGEQKNAKIPVLIDYSTYNGSSAYRLTEYTLKGFSAQRPDQA